MPYWLMWLLGLMSKLPRCTVKNTAKNYGPAVVAGLYLAYVLSASDSAHYGVAVAAFLAALGLSAQTASAHARIDALTSPKS
jgi:hypothetical protein